MNFDKANIVKLITDHFRIDHRVPELKEWEEFVRKIGSHLPEVPIALVGKYTGLKDAYYSVIEAVKAAGYFNNVKIHIVWIDAEKIEKDGKKENRSGRI